MAYEGPLHKNQTIENGLHSAIAYEYPNEAARLSDGPYENFDKYKFAVDADGYTVHLLVDPSAGTWVTVPTSFGSITGPISSSDNAIVRWNGASGDVIKNSTALLSDIGALTLALGLTVGANIDVGGNNIVNVNLVDGVDISSHASRHQNGGADEISVAGLSGLLADGQTPLTHASSHEDGGSDEIDGTNINFVYTPTNYDTPATDTLGDHIAEIDAALAGTGGTDFTDSVFRVSDNSDATKKLAFEVSGIATATTRTITVPNANITLDDVSSARTPTAHASSHQNGGADEISVAGLSGLLADGQTPLTHASSHEDGGSDEIDGTNINFVYTPTNYDTPATDTLGDHIAEIDAALAGTGGTDFTDSVFRVSDNSDATKKLAFEVSGIATATTRTITVPNANITLDDASSARTPTAHASSHQNGGADEISVAGLSGLLADGQTPLTHASSHEDGGSDEIDGTNINFVYTPTNYDTPATDTLGDHIAEIDAALAGTGGTDFTDSVFRVSDNSDATKKLAFEVSGIATATTRTITVPNANITLDDASSARTPTAHASSHQNGGADEISVAGLSGLLADGQTPLTHASSHQNGGADEISVAGLSGLLADGQTPLTHASSHEDGGSDEIDGTNINFVYTPTNYDTPATDTLGDHIAEIDAALAGTGGTDFTDSVFRVSDNSDTTKKLAFEVSGIATATTRTITVPNANITLDDASSARTPTAHASSHQNGGADEISVAGLSGLLADGQTPLTHASSHQNGGADEISVAGLSGLLADGQTPLTHASSHEDGGSDEIDGTNINFVYTPTNYDTPATDTLGDHIAEIDAALAGTGGTDFTDSVFRVSDNSDATKKLAFEVSGIATATTRTITVPNANITLDDVSSARTPTAHASSHQNGGADEISVAGLSGLLADGQTPLTHASSHEDGGSDEIDGTNINFVYTPTNYDTPATDTLGDHIAEIDAALAGTGGTDFTDSVFRVSDNSDTTKKLAFEVSGIATATTRTITVPNANITLDDVSSARTPTAHASSHQNGGADEISVAGLSGLLADGQTPLTHASSHEDGGSDEIDGTNINFVYTPTNYDTPATDTLGDHIAEIDAALAGTGGTDFTDSVFRVSDNSDATKKLAFEVSGIATATTRTITVPNANITLDDVSSARTPTAHASSHQNGGADEISVAGLSGLLADGQTPLTHASSHEDGGSDEIDGTNINFVYTPTNYDTPATDTLGDHIAEIDAALAGTGGTDFTDSVFRVSDNSDTTKKLAFEVSGIATATTRTITVPNANITLDDASSARTPTAHASSHQNGGADEISVAGLSGLLADGQTPLTHASSHQNGGADEISVAGLSGLLADGQTPLTHASSHEDGGSDEIDGTNINFVYTPTNYDTPATDTLGDHIAEIDAALAGTGGTDFTDSVFRVSDNSDATKKLAFEVSGIATATTRTITVPNANITLDDVSSARTPTAHASSHQNGGADEISVAGLSGLLADGQTPLTHASSHEDGGSDEIDGTNINFVYTPTNYDTPATDTLGDHIAEIDAALAGTGGTDFTDSVFRVSDNSDATKKLAFEVSGIATATTRTITVPNANITLDDASSARTPTAHASSHQNGGADEISVAGLSGLLADGQTPLTHASSHQNGGADEISVAGLSGLLADGQTPLTHASSHEDGGSDEIDGTNINFVYTPTNYDTPATDTLGDHIAEIDAALAGTGGTDFTDSVFRVSDNSDATKKLAFEVSGIATATTRTITVPNANITLDDASSARTPTAHASSHQNGGADEISVAGLSGLLADGQTPLTHASSHQNGGADEISVAGLSGLLADGQTPLTHASSHEDGGSDEIDGTNINFVYTPTNYDTPATDTLGDHIAEIDAALAGTGGTDFTDSVFRVSDNSDATKKLAFEVSGIATATTRTITVPNANITLDDVSSARTPTAHASSHQNGGADEISVAGLSGLLADGQTPLTHASSHEDGGSDEIDGTNINFVYTPTNYDTPATDTLGDHIAEIDAALAGTGGTDFTDSVFRVSDNSDATKKLAFEVSGIATATTRTITVPNANITLDDASSARTPTAHASSHQNGGADEISVAGLSGLLADGQTPLTHASSHQNGGADEISVAGLSGLLADGQTPLTHASSHEDGGSDEIDGTNINFVYTPTNYDTPATDTLGDHIAEIDAALAGTGGTDFTDSVFRVSDNSDATKKLAFEVSGIATATTRTITVPNANITLDDASSARTPTAHASSHQNGGADEISVAGLSGLLADGQTPLTHASSHQNGGADEISVAGLSGLLADGQTPLTHASSHEDGGSDEIDGTNINFVYTPTNYDTPATDTLGDHIAEIDAALAGTGGTDFTDSVFRVSDNSDATKKLAFEVSGIATATTRTITVPNANITLDDASSARTPTAHASSHQNGGADEISVAGLSGLLADGQTALSVGSTGDVQYNNGSGGLGSESVFTYDSSTNTLSVPIIKSDNIVFNSEYNNGNSGSTITINWNNGQKQRVTLNNSSVTINFTAPPGPCNLLLKIIQDSGGNKDITTYPSESLAPSGGITLSTVANSVDIAAIYYDGSNYYWTIANAFSTL